MKIQTNMYCTYGNMCYTKRKTTIHGAKTNKRVVLPVYLPTLKLQDKTSDILELRSGQKYAYKYNNKIKTEL